jgi:hypothetical protein
MTTVRTPGRAGCYPPDIRPGARGPAARGRARRRRPGLAVDAPDTAGAGRRLATTGAVDEPDDVFWLRREESRRRRRCTGRGNRPVTEPRRPRSCAGPGVMRARRRDRCQEGLEVHPPTPASPSRAAPLPVRLLSLCPTCRSCPPGSSASACAPELPTSPLDQLQGTFAREHRDRWHYDVDEPGATLNKRQ